MSATAYDAIVVGAGHNGLVAAAYLARAGLKTAVFEARHVVGGAAVTEELWPGFKVSRCAYVNSLFQPEIVATSSSGSTGSRCFREIRRVLRRFPTADTSMLGPDKDLVRARDLRSFRCTMPRTYPRYEAAIEEIAAVLEPMMAMVPPNPGQAGTGGSLGLRPFRTQAPSQPRRRKWPDVVRMLDRLGAPTFWTNGSKASSSKSPWPPTP